MATPSELLEQNRRWSDRMQQESPALLERLSDGQSPDVLWLGCADSRVPATQVVDARPGDLFVHRNVANLLVPVDPNGMSVLTYAVDELEVSDIVVCGHYQCGGVKAVLSNAASGVLGDWLAPVHDVVEQHADEFDTLDEEETWNRCCELNVEAQVERLANVPIVREAWHAGRDLAIHGWMYRLSDGRIEDLGVRIDG